MTLFSGALHYYPRRASRWIAPPPLPPVFGDAAVGLRKYISSAIIRRARTDAAPSTALVPCSPAFAFGRPDPSRIHATKRCLHMHAQVEQGEAWAKRSNWMGEWGGGQLYYRDNGEGGGISGRWGIGGEKADNNI
jgi:hypothetical protein